MIRTPDARPDGGYFDDIDGKRTQVWVTNNVRRCWKAQCEYMNRSQSRNVQKARETLQNRLHPLSGLETFLDSLNKNMDILYGKSSKELDQRCYQPGTQRRASQRIRRQER